MLSKIKSFYLVKQEILDYLPTSYMLNLFKTSKKYLKNLELTPVNYELYFNIRKDFEQYDDYLENDMLSFIPHLSIIQSHIPLPIIKEYYFRFLREQETISVFYINNYFEDFLNFMDKRCYKGNIVIQFNDLNFDFEKYPNIDIYNNITNVELFFNIKWIDKEKNDNMLLIQKFLQKKIIGISTRNNIKKIKFNEYLNLNDDIHIQFHDYLVTSFPNCELNLQYPYYNDQNEKQTANVLASDIEKFHQLKMILDDADSGKYSYSQINKFYKFLTSINNLHDLSIDFKKNKIDIIEKYLENSNVAKPEKITLIDFWYDRRKEYFGELNDYITELVLVQVIYKRVPFPIRISNKLNCLMVLQLEKINILEDNLVNVVRNNTLLEIFEITKNFSRYVYGKKLALALSRLKNLKILTTNYFWYKDNLNSYDLFDDKHIKENNFFYYLKSGSLKYLTISNECNINLTTIAKNVPNLIRLSIEMSNVITYDITSADANSETNNSEKKNLGFYMRKKEKNQINIINDNSDDNVFLKMRNLNLIRTLNIGSFFKSISNDNKIENLKMIHFNKNVFDIFVDCINNLTNISTLIFIPDYNEKIAAKEYIKLINNLDCLKKLISLEIGFYNINDESLIKLIYTQIKRLTQLKYLKIIIEYCYESNKKILLDKVEELQKVNENLKINVIFKKYGIKK